MLTMYALGNNPGCCLLQLPLCSIGTVLLAIAL